jgi:hypothetical protein
MSDERPKPKYGELAPEGWVWKPPQPETPADPPAAAAPTPASVQPPASVGQTPQWGRPTGAAAGGSAPDAAGPAKPRSGDRIATIILLAAGLLGTANMVTSFLTLPVVMQQFMELQNIPGVYAADADASSAGAIGATVLVVVYVLALVISIRRMRAGRLTFFVPIIGAVLSFIVNLIVVMVAILADPNILGSLQP